MIDPELSAKLDEIGAKAERAYQAAETVRKYLFWTGIITIILIIVPAIGLAFAIPSFLSSYATTLSSLGY